MNILFNGESIEVSKDTNLTDLINERLGRENKPLQKFVVLRNGAICKDNPVLQPDDTIDLISFVGGG